MDEETGKLIPNRNYYEIYLKKPVPPKNGIFEYGVYDVFEQICGKLELKRLLKRYFPENYTEMLTAAQYMLSEGNVMYYISDYTETHTTALKGVLSDEKCSKMLASLRQEDMLLFFREWMKHKKSNEYVAEYRIERAKELLKRGVAVKATALSCGFADPLYFSKAFCKAEGISPREFRRRFEIK